MAISKVVLGSESDTKRRAVAAALKTLGIDVDIAGYKTESGVSAQPQGINEITRGATNRMGAVQRVHPDADLCIGIESGIIEEFGRWFDIACVAVLEPKNARTALSYSAHFPIPAWMVTLALFKKTDLGNVARDLVGGGEKDPIALLSNGTIFREHLVGHAVQYALVEILYPENYRKLVREE